MGDLLVRRAASTAATYYKVLKLLYAWLAEEEEIPTNPMARMKPPIVPDKPVPIAPRMSSSSCSRRAPATPSRRGAPRRC
jgi:hypothetical protein